MKSLQETEKTLCYMNSVSIDRRQCKWQQSRQRYHIVHCDTRIPGREVMLGVPSRPRASVGTQTAPKPFPPRMLHQAVDTMDLEQGLKGLNISTQTPQVWAGRAWKDPEEGAVGEVRRRRDTEEEGWELSLIHI